MQPREDPATLASPPPTTLFTTQELHAAHGKGAPALMHASVRGWVPAAEFAEMCRPGLPTAHVAADGGGESRELEEKPLCLDQAQLSSTGVTRAASA
eukprot:CAMPEP_0184327404 /NCGR_PEP_ID=MMETSP1049-20130417/143078_1 /TAXON_ID=77928 /ORGANISM="Proteomonas sulcata, Strain CCMP704" /LENGTH=96 /DNA_ID=CAMNT_0026649661 /DNA_START=755 /DNA_END=1041 /DNA_ORIENTATION=-